MYMVAFFVDSFRDIMDILACPDQRTIWIVSQIFAFIALIFMVWSFQEKKKLKVMLLLGFGTFFLAISAAFLENWTLAVLFAIASIRNYVFWFFDWRVSRGFNVPKSRYYFFAGVFITATVLTTALIGHLGYAWWLEIMICVTLIGLIVGNVLEGQNVMRLSFVANRVFNIINHVAFGNAIAVIIAALAIGSNGIYYFRMLLAWRRGENIQAGSSASAIAAQRAAKAKAAEEGTRVEEVVLKESDAASDETE